MIGQPKGLSSLVMHYFKVYFLVSINEGIQVSVNTELLMGKELLM